MRIRRSASLYGKTRANDVWYRLREDILAGLLLPGQWLRFEKLRSVYDVSYATLREALSKLAYEGLVIADAQKGFTVAPIRASDLADLTSVRIMIETETLRRSMKKGGEEWRSNILAAFHKMDRGAKPQLAASRDWAVSHGDFHRSLVAACDSPLLLEYRATLFDKANRYRRLATVVRPTSVDRSNEHREMMEAVLSGDADYACALVSHHIQQTADDILASISSNADLLSPPKEESAAPAAPVSEIKEKKPAVEKRRVDDKKVTVLNAPVSARKRSGVTPSRKRARA